MTGQVDEPTKKRRSAELLALAADARARWAAARVGREAQVLFETRLADGRWIGHAADHTLVAAATSASARSEDLENVIARVATDAVDPNASDRVVGRILDLSRPPQPIGAAAHAS
jgi:tRNA A37 methylthiotransferase MiaB